VERTVSLDGDIELFCNIKDIVEIFGIQLGSEKGVPVHYLESAKVPRV
jgi:hypothetical protein